MCLGYRTNAQTTQIELKEIQMAKKPIPAKELRKVFQTLPNIDEKQLKTLRPYVSKNAYKKLRKLSGFIDQGIINDLKKETQSLMQMAADLTSDISFSDLVEQ